MDVSSVENQDIGAQVRMFFNGIFCAKFYSLCFQSARKLGAVPSPGHFQGLANVEEVAVLPKQSENGEVEEVGRKSLLMQLQMIIDEI